jgi:TM2 domain-containing membrane protein YozV
MSEESTTQLSASAYTKEQKDKKMIAGLIAVLGIVYGGWGIHKFYLGYTKEGVVQLLLCLACGIGTIIGVIEGIIYLTKSDDEFVATYVVGQKGWF